MDCVDDDRHDGLVAGAHKEDAGMACGFLSVPRGRPCAPRFVQELEVAVVVGDEDAPMARSIEQEQSITDRPLS